MTRLMATTLTVLLAAALGGCTTTAVKTRPGSFFALSGRNVAYRDLTQPLSVDNDAMPRDYDAFPAAQVQQPIADATDGYSPLPIAPPTSSRPMTNGGTTTYGIAQRAQPLPLPAGATASPSSASVLWTAPAGTSVLNILVDWTKQANWTLLWIAHSEGPTLLTTLTVHGDLRTAVRELVLATKPPGAAPYPLKIQIPQHETSIHVIDKD